MENAKVKTLVTELSFEEDFVEGNFYSGDEGRHLSTSAHSKE
jgi:hypothetical protein